MEFINFAAIERFRSEGVPYLSFGFTPFEGVAGRLGSPSRSVKIVRRLLAAHGASIYPARSQVAYKLKWGPLHIEPEYLGFQRRFCLADLWVLLRATRSI